MIELKGKYVVFTSIKIRDKSCLDEYTREWEEMNKSCEKYFCTN